MLLDYTIRTRSGRRGMGLLSLPLLVLAAFAISAVATSQRAVVSTAAAETAAAKLESIRNPEPGQTVPPVTRFSEEEVNSYLHYDLSADFPPGLEGVSVRFTPSRIQGTAEVDFDKASAARRGRSTGGFPPMMDYLLRGRHTLTVEGGFSAIGGMGHFDLESVALDGMTIPQPLVDVLIDTYIKPRHPRFNLHRPFRLPYSIDRIQVERGSIDVEVASSPVAL